MIDMFGAQELSQVPQVVAVCAHRVRAVARIGQVRQEPVDQCHLVAAVIEQQYLTDDAVLSLFDPDNRELGDHRQHVEGQLADRVCRVMDGPAKAELDLACRELGQDVTGIRQRACEPVQLGDDQGVTGAAGRQCHQQPRTVAVGAAEAVVNVDPVVTNTERGEAVALCCEILLFC
jgi:hypothetical protein